MSKHQPIHAEEWLHHLTATRGDHPITLPKTAINLYDSKSRALLEKGLGIADILLNLGLDNETLACAIAYPALQVREIHMDSIVDCLGERSSKLLHDVLQMQSLGKLQHYEERGNHQLENLRKMLLAMVTDIRAVLIVLAERLWELRQAKNRDKTEQQQLASETFAVYAPLANRLGLWQVKWEMEDFCLRYSAPDVYANIAKGIAARRDDREVYIKQFIHLTKDILSSAGIPHFEVTGRVKHIYSIYRKMMRKHIDLEKIYDMSAIRVMVDNIETCYTVLSILQHQWQHVQEEFDDYISNPKPNGYQSIHTVLIGPDNHYVEVQIRTHKMHQESELGVAAHWRYKEGVLQTSSYEAKIALLRQLMEWQKEVVGQDESSKPAQDLFADTIYVFTPAGDIIDLPKGATPLDFAYTIHSEVGHRCRGAKVDGNIVPLIYQLQTGQRVEILTAKQAHPSRDWLSPHRGFIKSARARAKIQHWFREQDSQHEESGELQDKEVKRQQPLHEKTQIVDLRTVQGVTPNVGIVGINNLLTHIARCCKPLPGDPIVGYVTRNRGLSIHRRDCPNIMDGEESGRRMDVSWGEKHKGAYAADLLVRIHEHSGLLRDLTTMLTNEKVSIQALQIQKVKDSSEADLHLTVEIAHREQLKTVLEQIRKMHGVIEARRR
jgi:GTP pyrophosphokinase